MAEHWYALRVKPHKEKSVNQHLQTQEIEVFFPTVKVKPKNPRNAKIKPYFPGYLFICTDIEAVGINAFNWMPGTLGLVAFGGEPAVVPANLIHELRTRLAEIEAAGGLTLEGLKPGDRVRIVSGPFAGYEAIFDTALPGKDRVQVLLAFLSEHPQPIKLHTEDIEKSKKR